MCNIDGNAFYWQSILREVVYTTDTCKKAEIIIYEWRKLGYRPNCHRAQDKLTEILSHCTHQTFL